MGWKFCSNEMCLCELLKSFFYIMEYGIIFIKAMSHYHGVKLFTHDEIWNVETTKNVPKN